MFLPPIKLGHCSKEEGENGYYGQVIAVSQGPFAYLFLGLFVLESPFLKRC